MMKPHQLRWIESRLIANDIDFVLIGGVAVRAYCPERETEDVDLFLEPSRCVLSALIGVLPQLAGNAASERVLSPDYGSIRIGGAFAIDALFFPAGLEFQSARRSAVIVEEDGTPLPVLGRKLLIEHKEAVGQRKGLDDAEMLRSVRG